MEIYLSTTGRDKAGRMPSPEDVFLSWMFSLPAGADLPQAARIEIARIDGAGHACAALSHLRGLFQQAIAGPLQSSARRQRRVRH